MKKELMEYNPCERAFWKPHIFVYANVLAAKVKYASPQQNERCERNNQITYKID